MEKGRPEQAAVAYLKALDAAPDDPDLLSELGVAYEALGQLGKSIELHLKALEIEPDALEVSVRLASAYLAGENADQALPLLEKVRRELRTTDEEVDPDLRDAVHEGIGQAIHLQIGALLTVLPDGARIITLESQANKTLDLLERVQGLDISDPELRGLLGEDRQMAEDALRVTWFWPPLFRQGWELFHLRLWPWYHDDGFAAGLRALGFFFALVALVLWTVVSVIVTFAGGGAAGVLNVLASCGALFGFVWLTCRKPTWELVHSEYTNTMVRRR
jgi:tetratricopeptide (TPR) repeat protein